MQKQKPKAHARLSPSAAKRWATCPASVELIESLNLPESRSKYSDEGTFAHAVAEAALRKAVDPQTLIGTMLEAEGQKRIVTAEIAEAVSHFTEYIWSELRENVSLFIEEKVSMDSVYKGISGTADAILFDPATKLCQIVDYKHGAGVFVPAENNYQLILYAIGAQDLFLSAENFRLVIVQPLCPSDKLVRTFDVSASELKIWKAKFKDAAKAVNAKGEKPFVVDEDACRFCPAKVHCQAQRKHAREILAHDFADLSAPKEVVTLPDPKLLSVEQLSKILEGLPLVEQWIKAIEGHALSLLETGGKVPGFKLVEKRATRKWIDENKVKETLTVVFDLEDLYEPPALKSPAQIEKLKGVDKKLLESFTVKVSSGLTLAPESDKRPAVSPKVSKDDFEKVEQ